MPVLPAAELPPDPEVISPWPAAPVPGVEDWHAIPGTEGCYEFSVYLDGDTRPLGWVRSWHTTQGTLRSTPFVLKPILDRQGYRRNRLYLADGWVVRRVHQICLQVYAGPRPTGAITRHLDGNPINNHPENLRWGTYRENSADSIDHGVIGHSEAHCHAKLRNIDIGSIFRAAIAGESPKAIGKRFGVTGSAIDYVLTGNGWTHVTSREPYASIVADYRAHQAASAALKARDVEGVLRALIAGASQREVARLFGMDNAAVSRLTTGRYWAHVTSVEPCASLLAQYRAQLAQRRSALCGPASLPAAQPAVRR